MDQEDDSVVGSNLHTGKFSVLQRTNNAQIKRYLVKDELFKYYFTPNSPYCTKSFHMNNLYHRDGYHFDFVVYLGSSS